MTVKDRIKNTGKDGREYRGTEAFRALESIGDGNTEKVVEGHACTFNHPYELLRYKDWDDTEVVINEQIDPHAFDECDMSDVIMQYDHAGRVMARTRNQTLTVQTDETGLFVRAELSKSTEGPGLYEDIKNGLIDRMSFGFVVDTDKITETRDGDKDIVLRTVTKIRKLYDVSAVSIPANDGTDISARSFCDGVIAEVKAERLLRQKKEDRRKLGNIKMQLIKSILE